MPPVVRRAFAPAGLPSAERSEGDDLEPKAASLPAPAPLWGPPVAGRRRGGGPCLGSHCCGALPGAAGGGWRKASPLPGEALRHPHGQREASGRSRRLHAARLQPTLRGRAGAPPPPTAPGAGCRRGARGRRSAVGGGRCPRGRRVGCGRGVSAASA